MLVRLGKITGKIVCSVVLVAVLIAVPVVNKWLRGGYDRPPTPYELSETDRFKLPDEVYHIPKETSLFNETPAPAVLSSDERSCGIFADQMREIETKILGKRASKPQVDSATSY